jgi:predicted ATPase/DNA-binding winged helix-turn-helix (wHTH) protein
MNRAINASRSHLSIVPPPSVTPLAGIGRMCFDRFVLTPQERLLTKDGAPVKIGGRSFDLLLALLEQPGRVVPKRELVQRVWPDVVVEDAALRFHMTCLRRILDDGRGDARLITTQVGVGYAFVGVVQRAKVDPPLAPIAVERRGPRLPSRVDRLIGRGRDVHDLVERLPATRLLTIVGGAGVGKTSLAIEIAHALQDGFPHGADFIDLSIVDTPGRLAPTIAQALCGEIGHQNPLSTVLDHLCGRTQLLVLDNCEHLLGSVADLIELIAATAPGVRLLATSRQTLRARNEHVHRLSPHETPVEGARLSREALLACPAVELFLHHASTAGGPIGEDEEQLRTVARLCGRLDGVALAIEHAAIRAATYGPDTTLEMLEDGRSLLWPGRRTALSRQRTLAASFDWSYALLSAPERRVFERLSELPGPFALETALDAVTDATLDAAVAAAALDELAEKFLILPVKGQYKWSNLARAYARSRSGAICRSR